MFSVGAFLIGLIFGSFGTALLTRLPQGETLLTRSHCPYCRKKLGAFELIPLLSFLLLCGRCRGCGRPVSRMYPLVECASGLLFLFAFLFTYPSLLSAMALACSLWLLLLLALIDFQTRSLPDILTIPLICAGVLFSLSRGEFSLAAPLLGGGFFALQYLLSGGRWVGSGDILLGVAAGALLGTVHGIAVALFFSYIVGAAVAALLLLTGKVTRKDHLPFAPFLAVGVFLSLLFQESLLALVT